VRKNTDNQTNTGAISAPRLPLAWSNTTSYWQS